MGLSQQYQFPTSLILLNPKYQNNICFTMLEDKLKVALSKPNQELLIRSPADGTLKNSRSGALKLGKVPAEIMVQGVNQDAKSNHSKRYSQSSFGSRNTRRVKLNNRGQKQDTLTQNYFSKNFNHFATTYQQDFQSNRDKEQQFFAMKTGSVDFASGPQSPMYRSQPSEAPPAEQMNLQERIIAQITNTTSDVSHTTGSGTNVLESIPPNDPIWTYIIPENVLKDPNINLERLIEENYDYFANLLGLVFQERSQRDFTFTKLHFPQQFKSGTLYHQDFRKKDGIPQSPNLNSLLYEQLKASSQNIGIQTTYQQCFKTNEPVQLESCKPKEERNIQPMSLLTSYQNQFLNWKVGSAGTMKKIYNKSTGNLPFIGKSSYQDQYKTNDLIPNPPFSKKKIGPFASGTDMVYVTSLNQDTFKPFSVKAHSTHKTYSGPVKDRIPQNESEILQNSNLGQQNGHPLGSYSGQFQTSSQKSQQQKTGITDTDTFNINNRKVWKRRLVQKFEELRQLRQSSTVQ